MTFLPSTPPHSKETIVLTQYLSRVLCYLAVLNAKSVTDAAPAQDRCPINVSSFLSSLSLEKQQTEEREHGAINNDVVL